MALPSPFDIHVFLKMVAELRGRPIILYPGMNSGEPDAACGLWLPRDDHDVILVHPQASTLHLEHIVLHEVGHMMCNHITEEAPLIESAMFQGFSTEPGALAKMLARTSYDTVAEREAETFATVLGSRITASRPDVPDKITRETAKDESLGRLITALSKTRDPRHH